MNFEKRDLLIHQVRSIFVMITLVRRNFILNPSDDEGKRAGHIFTMVEEFYHAKFQNLF